MKDSKQSTRFFVVVGLMSCAGAVSSPQILANNTDPSPSFVQGILLAVVSLLSLGVVCVCMSVPARVLVVIVMLVDLAAIWGCSAWLLAR
jgi:hypothetical protein